MSPSAPGGEGWTETPWLEESLAFRACYRRSWALVSRPWNDCYRGMPLTPSTRHILRSQPLQGQEVGRVKLSVLDASPGFDPGFGANKQQHHPISCPSPCHYHLIVLTPIYTRCHTILVEHGASGSHLKVESVEDNEIEACRGSTKSRTVRRTSGSDLPLVIPTLACCV